MKHLIKTGSLACSLALGALFFTACEKEEDTTANGTVQFEITDAPIDDANIKGAFVTVTDIKVDGKSFAGFSGKQTINLLAYQNGTVKGLGSGELETGAHSNVTLVLDYDKDASGNSPGCYVETTDNVKHSLKTTANTTSELTIPTNFTTTANSQTKLVMDFDVRKAIAYGTTAGTYKFNADNDLKASVRVVDKTRAGTVKGKCKDDLNKGGSKIVVYAYKKGTFNATTEKQGNIQFKNAVSSAVTASDGSYTLAFLEEGDYELHYVGYEDSNNDGKMEAKGFLLLDLLGTVNLNSITVGANATVQVDVNVTGFTPF